MDIDKSHLCDGESPKKTIDGYKMKQVGGWTWRLVLAGVATTVGLAVPVGYTIGVVNTPAAIIKSWCNESIVAHYDSHLSPSNLDSVLSAIVSIFLIGGMIGSLTGSWVADKTGRKGSLVIGGGLLLIAALLFVLAKPLNSVEIIFVGRILAGLGGGLVTAVMPMYLTELAPLSLRGAMGVLCPMGLSLGVPISQVMGFPYILGTPSAWNYLLGLYSLLTLICILMLPFLPESPKYLYSIRGLRQRAIKELSNLRELPPELVCGELEAKMDNETETWSVLKVIKSRPLRINLLLVCALQAGQQCSGINAVFYYSVRIFESAGLSELNAQYASLGAGSINFVISMLMIPLINLFRRRTLALTSCFFATTFLILLAFSITFKDSFSWMLYLSTFSLFGYIVAYGIGLGPIPFFIGSELFDLGPRPAAMALGSVSNWAGNFFVGMTFLALNSLIGPYSFLPFALSTCLLGMFVKFCLPETNAPLTKNVSSEE